MFAVKRMAAQLASLGMVVGGITLAAAQPAAAGEFGCPGSQVGSHNIKDDAGRVWGTLYVYYSSADGGTNCLANKAVRYYGTPHTIRAFISGAGKSKNDSQPDYKYYAGPVAITGTNGHCITIEGEFVNPDRTAMESLELNNVYCG